MGETEVETRVPDIGGSPLLVGTFGGASAKARWDPQADALTILVGSHIM